MGGLNNTLASSFLCYSLCLLVSQMVIKKVADPLIPVQDFISSTDFGNSGVVKPEVINILSLMLVFIQYLLFQLNPLFKYLIRYDLYDFTLLATTLKVL